MPSASPLRSSSAPAALWRLGLAFALALTLSVCADSPTGLPKQLTPLVSTDTVDLSFSTSGVLSVTPIASSSQRLILIIDSDSESDSLWARLIHNNIVIDSVIAHAAPAHPREHFLWIPLALSEQPLTVRFDWIRRTGGTRVRAHLLTPDQEPEHGSILLAVGDTAVEQVDGTDDVDVFFIQAPPDTRLTFWAQSDSATEPFSLMLRTDASERRGPAAVALDSALVLAGSASSFFDTYAIVRRSNEAAPAAEPFSAGYRLWVKAIDPEPETAATALVHATVATELVDEFADVDSFTIPVGVGEQYRLIFAQDSASARPIRVALMTAFGPQYVPLTAADSTLDLRRTPWIVREFTAPYLLVSGDTSATANRTPLGYRVLYEMRQRAPEIAPAALERGDSVSTETLASCADADEFIVSGAPSSLVGVGAAVYERPSCRVRLMVFDGNALVQEIEQLPEGTDPDVMRLPSYPIPASGSLRVRVEGLDSLGQPLGRETNIGYKLDIFAIDTTPELAAETLPAGDTLDTETISRCGDVDTYELTAAPGSLVLIGARPTRETGCRLSVSIENSGTGSIDFDANPDFGMFRSYPVPASGKLPLRIASERLGTSADRDAPYRLTTDFVLPAPETASATVVLGDTIHEPLERCGDVDVFEVSANEGDIRNVEFDRSRQTSCRLVLQVFSGPIQIWAVEVAPDDPLGPIEFGFPTNTTGVYTIHVSSYPSGHTDDRNLPYTLLVSTPINEVAPATLALGDTSVAEPYNSRFDFDKFTVPLVAGVEYVAATVGGNVFFTTTAPGSIFPTPSFETHTRGLALFVTPSVTGPRDFVIGQRLGPDADFPASYRFTVRELNRQPETISAALSAGDTTSVELIDHLFDEDRYTATLPAGRFFRLETLPSPLGAKPATEVLNSGGEYLGYIVDTTAISTARGAVPADGQLRIQIRPRTGSTDTLNVPSYRLLLVELNPAPETAASALTAGVTTSSESLDDPYDLDEFTFTATSTGPRDVIAQAVSSCGGGDDRLRVTVRTAAGASVADFPGRTDATAAATPTFTAGVSYVLRVEALTPSLGNCLLRGYSLRVGN